MDSSEDVSIDDVIQPSAPLYKQSVVMVVVVVMVAVAVVVV